MPTTDTKLITAGVPLKNLPPSVVPRVRAARKAAATRKRREEAGTARPRDTQRQKVYDWERAHVESRLPNDKNVPLAELGQLIQKAYVRYGFGFNPHLQLGDGRGRKNACFDYRVGGGTIKLPLWARSEWVALHEAAHGIVWRQFDRDAKKFAGHGPEFVRVYIDLLAHFIPSLSAAELQQSAQAAGLKLVSAKSVAPPKKKTLTQRDKLKTEIGQITAQITALQAKRRELQLELTKINAEIRK
jgi:hypothetical protein